MSTKRKSVSRLIINYNKRKSSAKKKTPKNSVLRVKTCGDYYVETIRDHAINREGKLQYLLKWEDYGESENSWEFDEHLSDCTDARQLFRMTSVNGKHPPKYSWEEYDKCVAYLKKVVNTSYDDYAVLYRLSDKKYSIWELKANPTKLLTDIKMKIEVTVAHLFIQTFDTQRDCNNARLEAKDLMENVSKELAINENFGSFTQFFEFIDRRPEMIGKLNKWQKDCNKMIETKGEGKAISVANDVDMEVPDLEKYVCECVYDKHIFKRKPIAEKFVIHSCSCDDCYEERHECCTAVIGFPLIYNRKGVLSHTSDQTSQSIIFECNYNCKCSIDCPNRVVQRGRQYGLEVFRTDNRGWGVRALEAIPRGGFLSQYSGEIISLTEANQRPTTYLFDLSASLDSRDDEYTYVIDAQKYGNIGRFFNHSCEPNCRALLTWIDSYDKLVPKVSLFAIKPIRANEELTYDYGMQLINIYEPELRSEDTQSTDSGRASSMDTNDIPEQSNRQQPVSPLIDDKPSKVSFKKIECKCGSNMCRKYLYS